MSTRSRSNSTSATATSRGDPRVKEIDDRISSIRKALKNIKKLLVKVGEMSGDQTVQFVNEVNGKKLTMSLTHAEVSKHYTALLNALDSLKKPISDLPKKTSTTTTNFILYQLNKGKTLDILRDIATQAGLNNLTIFDDVPLASKGLVNRLILSLIHI